MAQKRADGAIPAFLLKSEEASHTKKIMTWANNVGQLSFVLWFALLIIIFCLSGPIVATNTIYQRVSPASSLVLNMAATVQMFAILLQCIHHFNLSQNHWINNFGNGVFKQIIVIMSVSVITNLLIANFPTPVLHDKITGLHVYPLRWAEWTVLVRSLFCCLLVSRLVYRCKFDCFL